MKRENMISPPIKQSRWRRYLKRIYERFVKIRGEPHKIALGFSLGLFVGMSPSMGVQMPIAIFIAALLKWNKISSAAGVWIKNPLTAPFIYSITYFTGARILGIKKGFHPPAEMDIGLLEKFAQKAPEIIWALLLGGLIIGIPLAVAGYYLSLAAVKQYQARLKQKLWKHRKRRHKPKKTKKTNSGHINKNL